MRTAPELDAASGQGMGCEKEEAGRNGQENAGTGRCRKGVGVALWMGMAAIQGASVQVIVVSVSMLHLAALAGTPVLDGTKTAFL
ncbi:hypothetical protein [Frateuria terrea]|uniref:hypothetical protein n=1 Tax=Frateuria terrea TaxID=529704 RepID=UPI001113C9AF|nr:hypothetical protein [Frateuria terrea]